MASAAQDPDEAASNEEMLRILKRVEHLLQKMLEQYNGQDLTSFPEQATPLALPEEPPPHTTQRRPRARHRSALEWDFTDREVEIIHLLCHPAGYTYDVIATMLGIHRGTLNGHLARIFVRMQVHNRSSVVMKWLVRHGKNGLQEECS